MRFLILMVIVMTGSACQIPEVPQRPPLVPAKVPPSSDVPGRVAELMVQLGSDDFALRERASVELKKLGREPDHQQVVVGVLRTAATHPDPEVRSRALEALRAIDRSESMAPGCDRKERQLSLIHQIMGISQSYKFWLRFFADGSAELEVEAGHARTELFSGCSIEELASRVNEALRKHGFSAKEFNLEDDGQLRMGETSIAWEAPKEHVIPDWGLWVQQASRSDGLSPPATWGGWVVQARSLGGHGFEMGIQLRDVIVEVDGVKPGSFQDLCQLLAKSRAVTLLRSDARRIELRTK